MKRIRNAAVARAFAAYPPGMRRKLLALRELILRTAAATGGVGPIEETLKWGEPAYVTSQTGSGSTIAVERDLLIETLRRMADERMDGPARSTTLRLELFVADLPASLDFYRRVLGFEPGPRQTGGYTPLGKRSVRIALNPLSDLPEGHPLRVAAGERPGLGVEIVLEVESIVAMHQHVVSENWPLSGELSRQSWGLTDFRISDPDGYYWRVTSRRGRGVEP